MTTQACSKTKAARAIFSSARSRKSLWSVPLAMSLLVAPLLWGQGYGQQYGQYPPDQSNGTPYDSGHPGYGQSSPYSDNVSPQQPYSATSYADENALQQGYNNVQPLSEQQLESLVAPIALYPDNLVAQILAASTYPQQVADADRWLWAQGNVPPEQIAAGADLQPWDPSVKALTAFPQVLSEMDHNLQWVSDLGNTYYNQPQDVLHAVQVMRWRAQAAGNLHSTPQESVTYEQGNILVAPANPQFVYVPEYNPWGVYGSSVAPYPGFSLLGAIGSFVGSTAVRFGWGIATAAFSHSPFGLLAWGLNWLTQAVLFHGSSYYSHSLTVRDWGLPYGGPRAFSRGGTFAGRSYRETGSYDRWSGASANSHSQGFYRAPNSSPNRDLYARSRLPEQSRGWQGSRSYTASHDDGFRSFRQPAIRSDQYSRSGSGWGFDNRQTYRSGNNMRYENMTRADRSRQKSLERGDFGKRAKSFKGDSFSRSFGKKEKKERSSNHFRAPKAPKSFSAKSFGHSHSGGHGHGGRHHG
jgi:hypothetical protein